MSAVTSPIAVPLGLNAGVPNNPQCPALHYRCVLRGTAPDMAHSFETLFERNAWPPAWRNGVFSHHHFHTLAHEALGVYGGKARVMLGGEGGVVVEIQAGDVVVVPAGVGHCKLECDGRLAIVGAYPAGQSPDLCTPDPAQVARRTRAVSAVAMPAADPVAGPGGPLSQLWHAGED